jgi:hypothetical protein
LHTLGSRGILGVQEQPGILRVFTDEHLSHAKPMDCRRFQNQHAQYVDDTLSDAEMRVMREHADACPSCSQRDTRLRRALLVARNAKTLELSPQFRRKLAARLAAERIAGSHLFTPAPWGARLFASAAALVLIAAGGGVTALAARRTAPAAQLSMAPIVVVPPALPAEPVAAPAMFATISSSLPVYSAVLLAQRASAQFAATHERTVTFQATH